MAKRNLTLYSGGKPVATGSDDDGGDMEARIARLESDVEYIKRDVGEIKVAVNTIRTAVEKINLRLAVATGIIVGATFVAGWLLDRRVVSVLEALHAAIPAK
jgi:hypothetical protein